MGDPIMQQQQQQQEGPQCELLDHFAIGVQMLMGCIVFSSLLVKRYRESPRRTWRVWFFDVSKQGFGAVFVHSLNVLVSLVAGAQPDSHSGNPCVYYFLNVAIDTTIGVYILVLWLRVTRRLAVLLGVERDLRSGAYGRPPRVSRWLKQCVVFSTCLFMMKLCVAITIYLVPGFEALGKWVLSPLGGNERLEVTFVMLIFPLIMNVVQFWLVDHVIKHKPATAAGSSSDLLDSDDEAPTALFATPSQEELLSGGGPTGHHRPPLLPLNTQSVVPTRLIGGSSGDLFVDDYLSDTSLLTSPDLGVHTNGAIATPAASTNPHTSGRMPRVGPSSPFGSPAAAAGGSGSNSPLSRHPPQSAPTNAPRSAAARLLGRFLGSNGSPRVSSGMDGSGGGYAYAPLGMDSPSSSSRASLDLGTVGGSGRSGPSRGMNAVRDPVEQDDDDHDDDHDP
ncbi:vacuolar membrane protein-domain-containing protein [Blastocladiella britannica]|nr:vacuolar membrane protein-domain-containing protein [Blastocladiella britannica]